MRILLLGMNHRTASVELRERLAFDEAAAGDALDALRLSHGAAEAVLLSTCNRTELYVARPSHEEPTVDTLRAFFAERCGVDIAAVTAGTIHRENDEAIGHLFRVAAGLDSMVLGEPQVLGQVKQAYEIACGRAAVGPVLHRVFQQAIAVAKEVRTATDIDAGRISVGSVAVDFARQIFDRFDDKVVVGIGAGEMAKLALRNFQLLKPAKLWIANRSPDRAAALATMLSLDAAAGGVRPFDDLDQLLVEADIVLTSTASPTPIITAARFKPLLRKRRNRPLFIIDIAVPRDVEAAVGGLKNVYLYNIDDLQRVVQGTHQQRSAAATQAEAMLADRVRACVAEIQNRDIGQLIRMLRLRLQSLGRAEQERTLRKLLTAEPHELADLLPAVLEEHTHRLVNKFLHLPLSQLDRRQSDAPLTFYAAALRRLFGLEDLPSENADADAAPPTPAPEHVEKRE